ncbi:3-oxoacyl-[acyl-carrier-protein] reductase FabG-like [Ixodes scapularis]|uniref:3-oxoacyl-[acyl-carrier-protein] reductase FabG-like n=1 Tax=Ixodes scapularis TaxID=6945 RepID=UPI001C382D81|nr:3-oxoacyl-[acyl-carrier-protein] reductase FabG-like [Ixodes scapularis]
MLILKRSAYYLAFCVALTRYLSSCSNVDLDKCYGEENEATYSAWDETSPTNMPDIGNSSYGLKGRLAIVTGGASGIGRSVCLVLAREGAIVVVADINSTGSQITLDMLKVISGQESEHMTAYVDVRNSTLVKEMFECVKGAYPDKNISIVVNSAGIMHKPTLLVNLSECSYDNTVDTNLKGTFLVTQEAVRYMLADNDTLGAIVNIASIVGNGGFPTVSAYAASKGGVIAFTKSVARELGTSHIRVNVVLPGGTETPMAQKYSNETKRKRLQQIVPMKRNAQPLEIAEVILFLCSNKSSYMTGSPVDVAGGTYM